MATRSYRQILHGSLGDFRSIEGPDLVQRVEPFLEWQDRRRAFALWPFSRKSIESSGPVVEVTLPNGTTVSAINFVGEDHLALSRHPVVVHAAQAAIANEGLNLPGSVVSSYRGRRIAQLETTLADFLKIEHVLTFPGGWTASFAALKAILRPQDHVIADACIDTSLVDAARCATPRVHLHAHCNVEAVRRILARIRAKDTSNAILVVTESQFHATSDTVNLRALREATREYGAFLMVGVTNDLGCCGAEGVGQLGTQKLAGEVDFVVGSLAKVFAVNGGFLAARSPAIREYVRCFSGVDDRSHAMSPVEVAIALASLAVVRSSEGHVLRERLHANAIALRGFLANCGLRFQGVPSAVVPVVIGSDDIARLATTISHRVGVILDLVEYPMVPRSHATIPLRLTVEHEILHLEQGAGMIGRAVAEATALYAHTGDGGPMPMPMPMAIR